jgi:hypothetical protein
MWAVQVRNRGGRKFFMATVHDVADAIKATQHPQSLYEIVGSSNAVRPYFDLEYSRTANPHRTAATDQQLVQQLLQHAEVYFKEQQWPTTVDRHKTVLLDASNTDKFSQHLIIHMTNNAALSGVDQAAAIAAWVWDHLPHALCMAQTATGEQQSVVDMQVYHRHQQMRLMGCVKLGDTRVLRLQHPTHCALADTLLTPDTIPTATYGRAARTGQHHGGSSTTSASTALAATLTAQLQQALHGGQIISLHTHSRHGTTHPSIYAHTTATHCAHRQHTSNKTVIEIDCSSQAWRLLCRDGCRPGQWQAAASRAAMLTDHAPDWLREHCMRWEL